jgi:plasmid stabilization system protein ParE
VATVVWTRRARRQLEEAIDYIAEDSPQAAEGFARRISTAIDQIARFPESGRVVPERGDPLYREVFVDRYRVVYRRIDTVIQILLVQHGVRPLPPI